MTNGSTSGSLLSNDCVRIQIISLWRL